MYLVRMGRDAELSEYCKEIIEKCETIGGEASWKLRTIYRIYCISLRLFDLISLLTGKRYKQRERGA